MKAYWLQFSTRIDAMSLRERIMVFAAGAGLMLFIVYSMVLEPLDARQKLLQMELRQQQNQLAGMDTEIAARVAAFAADPDRAAQVQLMELKKQTIVLTDGLRAMQHGLVAPEKMVGLLEQLLRSNGKLRMVSLRTLPVSGLNGTGAPATATAAANTGPKPRELLYRHGVELVLQGSYLDMLSYMEALQNLPSQLFWGKLQLSAQDYPKCTLTLTLYTLSLDEKWLTL